MSRSLIMTRRILKLDSLIRIQKRAYSAPLESSVPESKQKYVPTSGTYPKGFSVSGTHVGVKASNTKFPDLALIVSGRPCVAAAVFTTNQFKAAPVVISRSMLDRRHGEGITNIIVNSGCANAVTGRGGDEDALAMAETATARCNSQAPADDQGHRSIVMSTGVIGQRLPIQKILDKIPEAQSSLASTHEAWLSAAQAICTTDTFPKLLSTTFTLPGPEHEGITYSLAGMAKGAGMIHPNMATLLAILCTDCPITPSAANFLLGSIADQSFNSISVDGDTSTNDTLALLANGAANPNYTGEDTSQGISLETQDPNFTALSKVLTSFAQKLSHLVVRDGEGATKFVEVHVRNARSRKEAHSIAESIARSPLVKTALYGKDANWGRILCAIGYAREAKQSVDPKRTSVSFVPMEQSQSFDEGVLKLLVMGEPQMVDEARAARLLEDEDLKIDVDLATGNEEAKYWFCDFSHEYVTINGDYRT